MTHLVRYCSTDVHAQDHSKHHRWSTTLPLSLRSSLAKRCSWTRRCTRLSSRLVPPAPACLGTLTLPWRKWFGRQGAWSHLCDHKSRWGRQPGCIMPWMSTLACARQVSQLHALLCLAVLISPTSNTLAFLQLLLASWYRCVSACWVFLSSTGPIKPGIGHRLSAFACHVGPCFPVVCSILWALAFSKAKELVSFLLYAKLLVSLPFFFAFHRRDTNLFCFSEGILGVSSLVPCC